MTLFEKIAIGAGLVVVGTTVAYRYLLPEEHKEAVREVGTTVRTSAEDVIDTVSPLVSNGPTRKQEQEAAEQNRARTASQWEALGY